MIFEMLKKRIVELYSSKLVANFLHFSLNLINFISQTKMAFQRLWLRT